MSPGGDRTGSFTLRARNSARPVGGLLAMPLPRFGAESSQRREMLWIHLSGVESAMESKLKVAAKTRSTGSVATAAKTTDKVDRRTEASQLDLPELLAAMHAMRAG